MRVYTILKDPPAHIQNELCMFSPLVQRLLFSRGIKTKTNANKFFALEWQTHTDPFLYTQMEKAVDRIISALQNNETIGIYYDYDCDGIPGAVALFSTLRAIGSTNIVTFVPNRNEEGFGLNQKGIQELHTAGATLMVTIDCGTSDSAMVSKAQALGMDVIIVDHHLAGETTPDAYAIINPVLETTIPAPHPCGAGCIFKLLQALLSRYKNDLPIGWEKWQLDMVSIATLSDMVSLFGENRLFVHFGLSVLRKSPRPGVIALCKLTNTKQKTLTEEDIAFTIAPHINAASRMGNAKVAFKLLTTDDYATAVALAQQLRTLNEKRKKRVAVIVREVNKRAQHKDSAMPIWVFGDRSWEPSLAGLIAQKLMKQHNKTIFIWGQNQKGSYRSKQHNVFQIMGEVQRGKSMFSEFGGHRQAGGFRLINGKEIELEDILCAASSTLKADENKPLTVDAELSIDKVNESMEAIEKFAPFGVGNEKPLVAFRRCRVIGASKFGKYGVHTKYQLQDDTGKIDGVSFFTKPTVTSNISAVLGHLEYDTFNKVPRIRIKSLVE